MLEKRKFGNTDLQVSVIGFGAWGIGGPAMAGDIPIGWGDVDDKTSTAALEKSVDCGVNFFDTADFYGFGHSEELLGQTFGNRGDVIIASKVGHRLDDDQKIFTDYSGEHIINSCEGSLKRLKRDCIDYYQLHTAKVSDFENTDCIETMDRLVEQGKIRYWGVSLNTYNPFPEADYIFENKIGHGLQLVFNIINQKAAGILESADINGYGTIVRMPLQFGLLTGKFTKESVFGKDDHRAFRLPSHILSRSIDDLEEVWKMFEETNQDKTSFSLSFAASWPGVSTVIPGIKTPEQAVSNTDDIRKLPDEYLMGLKEMYGSSFSSLLDLMEREG